MDTAIMNLLEFFGLNVDTATMTLADGFEYMVFAIFALITIYLFYNFTYGIIRFFMSFGGGKL